MPAALERFLSGTEFKQALVAFLALAASTFSVQQWVDFHWEYKAFARQQMAVCSDGRRINQSVTQARFQVDDYMHDLDFAHGSLNCRFQVFVYPCDATSPATTPPPLPSPPPPWLLSPAVVAAAAAIRAEPIAAAAVVASICFGGVGADAPAAAFPLTEWRLSYVPAKVACARRGAWAIGVCWCEDAAWRCQVGPCTAYQKAALRCVPLLDRSPYACFYVPGDVAAGVSTQPFELPVGSGVFALAISLLLMGCGCGTCAKAVQYVVHEDIAGFGLHFMLVALMFACAVSLVIVAMGGSDSIGISPARAYEGGTWASGLNQVPPWQARVEGNPWRDMLLVGSALALGYMMLTVVAMCALNLRANPGSSRSYNQFLAAE